MPKFTLVEEFRLLPRWVVYRLVPDEKTGKNKKVPYQPKNPQFGADSTNPKHWASYEEATACCTQHRFDGVGLVIRPPYIGLDLDNAVGKPWAEEFVELSGTYCELSPSRKGYHLWYKTEGAPKDPKDELGQKLLQLKTKEIEIYPDNRYFTYTGEMVGNCDEVRELSKQETLEIYRRFSKPATPPPPRVNASRLTRLQRFHLLSLGKWKDLHASQSEADLEYCCFLAEAHAGNAQLVESDFKESPLFRTPAQGKHANYPRLTAETACKKFLEQEPKKGKLSQQPKEPLVVVDWNDFKNEDIKERKSIVTTQGTGSPVILEASLSQVFAKRGVGKSNLSLALAGAIAKGTDFLCWKATRRARVLYCEGEIPQYELQQRGRRIVGSIEPGWLKLVTLDKQANNRIHSLSDPAGQALLEDSLGDTEVVFFDSISTLVRIATNDEENWTCFLEWLMKLRSKGLAVVVLHHAGKQGLQRGHSRSEDNLDLSIVLQHPQDYMMDEGLRTQLFFDKTRHYVPDGDNIELKWDGKEWAWKWLAGETEKRVAEAIRHNPGWSDRKIAEHLNLSNNLVSRYHRKINEREDKRGQREEAQNDLGF